MALSRKRIFVMYVIASFFLAGIIFLFVNDYGVLKYSRLQNQVDDLNEQIKQVSDENKRLQQEIDSLRRNVPAKVEEIAREKYDMIREGEKTIKFEDSTK